MALENRGNGKNLYYYKKRRVNGRVVSSYCGSGRLSGALYRLDRLEAAGLEDEKRAGQEELKRLAAPLEEFDRALDAPEGLLKLLVDANLLAGGYHRHKGQWRRRKSTSTKRSEEE
jgi:hypothetical protein